MTQEYIKTQIAGTETKGHILILSMSLSRQIGRYGYFYEYRDTETGVHYLTTQEGGMCPRYDAYGNLYVD